MINIQDKPGQISETRSWKFNRRNVNRIAWENAAKVIDFNLPFGRATLRDDKDRIFWIYRVDTIPNIQL